MSNNNEAMPRSQTSGLDVMRHFRLVWQLLTDRRVSPWLKGVIPALALAYVLLPWDLVTDFIPVLGQLDDLAVLVLGMQLFIQLCPKGIVQEHSQGAPSASESQASGDEVVDATYRVVEEDQA
jgi:uncharacterized membrane protein YkvA (DUF1232 family)